MNPLDSYRIGFIGLGLMGRPMARHLHRAGAELALFNRTRAKADELVNEVAGARMQAWESPRAVASHADYVIIMVADTPALESVLNDADGVLSGISPGACVIDMGTSAVVATRRLAQLTKNAGADYVDAPVSGGEIGAQQASLSIMAGAAPAVFTRIAPILAVLGANITHVGDTGCGQIAKAANQIIVGLTIGAVAEALTLAERAGADPENVRQALMGGFAASRILEVHGARMVQNEFAPGGKIITQHKDLSQALELAATVGLSLPATELNTEQYAALIETGAGDLDHSALIKRYRR